MNKLALASLAIIALSQAATAATVTVYTDRAAFQAAISGEVVIDFEGLVASNQIVHTGTDSFTSGPVTVTGGGLYLVGPNGGWSGNPFNSTILSAGNGGSTTMTTTFGGGVVAFGAEFGDVDSAGNAGRFTLNGTTGQLYDQVLSVADMGQGDSQTFFGWVVSGDTLTNLSFVLQSANYPGMDNLIYAGDAEPTVGVPAPASALLALAGLAALARRQQVAN